MRIRSTCWSYWNSPISEVRSVHRANRRSLSNPSTDIQFRKKETLQTAINRNRPGFFIVSFCVQSKTKFRSIRWLADEFSIKTGNGRVNSKTDKMLEWRKNTKQKNGLKGKNLFRFVYQPAIFNHQKHWSFHQYETSICDFRFSHDTFFENNHPNEGSNAILERKIICFFGFLLIQRNFKTAGTHSRLSSAAQYRFMRIMLLICDGLEAWHFISTAPRSNELKLVFPMKFTLPAIASATSNSCRQLFDWEFITKFDEIISLPVSAWDVIYFSPSTFIGKPPA